MAEKSTRVGTRTSATPPYGCPRCESRWGGLNTGHCAACHITFSGITAFDQHRAGSHVKGRHCLDPETTVFQRKDGTEWSLVKLGRGYECWGFESDGHWIQDVQ